MRQTISIIYILLFICNHAESYAKGNMIVTVNNIIEFREAIRNSNLTIKINGTIDLLGESISLPSSCNLLLSKGKIVNGKLKGNDTKIQVEKPSSLGVILYGTWICPIIDDIYFSSAILSDDDIFTNINNLQSKNVHNTIYLKKKHYFVSIKESGGYALSLIDNTKLINESEIEIKSNNYKSYSIILISNSNNVEVLGGKIKGDVGRHHYLQGTTSEWGMGVRITTSTNVSVHDIYISNCTGDGIYITGLPTDYISDYSKASKNIVLRKVVCDFNRRQGLSVICVDGLLVEGCTFSNTGRIEKIPPSAGIDIEPNVNQGLHNSVRNILIKDCMFKGNAGRSFDADAGVSDGYKDNFENIIVTDCIADGPFFFGAQNIKVEKSKMESIIIRPYEAPVLCIIDKCKIFGHGIIIKDVLKHDILYVNRRRPKYLVDVRINRCNLTIHPKSYKKETKLVKFECKPIRNSIISFNSCSISVPNSQAIEIDNPKVGLVSFNSCHITFNGD